MVLSVYACFSSNAVFVVVVIDQLELFMQGKEKAILEEIEDDG